MYAVVLHLYIMHALYFEITTLIEVLQLMSIAGYEAYVLCATSCIKHYVHPSYGCCGTPVVACTCVYTVGKISLYISY